MKTYQDLLEAQAKGEKELFSFILGAISEHKDSPMYKTAEEADKYMRQLNPPIMNFQKLLYTVTGEVVPDNYSANHKCASNFFKRFVVQENQYLLGNGVTFENEQTKERLGGADFDRALQLAGEAALVGGVSFGYYNYDHVEVFKLVDPNGACFVPLWDEENGGLSAGIRFWQIDTQKPLRVTLYEIDGYTDYIQRGGEEITELRPKKTHKNIVRYSEIDGTEIYDSGNYPSFPIVPFWGNPEHQSELIGIKTQIDAYDLIKSGFANDLDDASMIYWTISSAGGMDDVDLAEFVRRLKTVHAANTSNADEGTIQSHTVDVPYQSRAVYLDRLENDMYNDFMALNIRGISAGNNTATAIDAAYEPMNNKADRYEYCVTQFIKGLLDLVGIEDNPTYKRSKLVNMTEETAMVLSAGLDRRTTVEHLPFISVDEREAVIERLEQEEMSRYDNAAVDEAEQQENISETEGGEAVEIAEQVADKQLNGAQTQSLISIILQYASGSLTLGQAVNIIAVAIGVTKEEAKTIIEGAE